jgi:hypothetical protein
MLSLFERPSIPWVGLNEMKPNKKRLILILVRRSFLLESGLTIYSVQNCWASYFDSFLDSVHRMSSSRPSLYSRGTRRSSESDQSGFDGPRIAVRVDMDGVTR